MRQKTSPTIVERAIISVPGFDLVFKRLDQQVVLKGQSHSALNNYNKIVTMHSSDSYWKRCCHQSDPPAGNLPELLKARLL